MQLPKLALILVLALFTMTVFAEERTELHLFKYGRTNTDQFKVAFFDFRDFLEFWDFFELRFERLI